MFYFESAKNYFKVGIFLPIPTTVVFWRQVCISILTFVINTFTGFYLRMGFYGLVYDNVLGNVVNHIPSKILF